MEEVEIDVESDSTNTETVEENQTESLVADATNNKDPFQRNKFLRLPLSRIKSIMKKDPDCALTNQDAVFLVTKATEMFIEYFAKELGKQVTVIGKRKTVTRKDVDLVINSRPELCFLDGALD